MTCPVTQHVVRRTVTQPYQWWQGYVKSKEKVPLSRGHTTYRHTQEDTQRTDTHKRTRRLHVSQKESRTTASVKQKQLFPAREAGAAPEGNPGGSPTHGTRDSVDMWGCVTWRINTVTEGLLRVNQLWFHCVRLRPRAPHSWRITWLNTKWTNYSQTLRLRSLQRHVTSRARCRSASSLESFVNKGGEREKSISRRVGGGGGSSGEGSLLPPLESLGHTQLTELIRWVRKGRRSGAIDWRMWGGGGGGEGDRWAGGRR